MGASKNRTDVLARSRRRQAWRRRVRILTLWLLVFMVLGAVWWFAHWERFLIKSIAVSGARTVEVELIKERAEALVFGRRWWLLPAAHEWWYPARALEASLRQEFPRLAAVQFEIREHALELAVREREPAVWWCHDPRRCYFADETGFVFAAAPQFSRPLFFELVSDLPAEPIGSYPLLPEEFKRLFSLRSFLPGLFAEAGLSEWQLTRAVAEGGDDYRLTLVPTHQPAEELFLLINLKRSWPNSLGRLAAALAAEPLQSYLQLGPLARANLAPLDYLDIRFDAKIFYRPKSEPLVEEG